jgi:hypothetical protein
VFIDRYSPNPVLSPFVVLDALGARWFPFGPTRSPWPHIPGASALYLDGDAGYAELVVDPSQTAKGFTAGVSAGWLGLQAADWLLGIEVSDHVIFLDSGEGTRNSLGATAFLELYLPNIRR